MRAQKQPQLLRQVLANKDLQIKVMPDDFVAELKKPFGFLIPDSQITKRSIQNAVAASRGIICVGDATTDRLLSLGVSPDMVIVDGKERRAPRPLPSGLASRKFKCSNPAGSISDDAIRSIEKALVAIPSTVVVDGEEDLLALPVFVLAPMDFVVFYGQPSEGMVVVSITKEKKERALELMTKIRERK